MIYDEEEKEFPKQWAYDEDEKPICTSFKDRDEYNAERRVKRKQSSPKKCGSTIDLFGSE